MQPEPALLEIMGVTKNFGGLKALDHVTATVEKDTTHGIIGPNGSGKTTLFNVLMGVFPADDGRVLFKGRDISKMPTYLRSHLGLARTFQQVRLFRSLTVRQNIAAAYLEHQKSSVVRRMFTHSRKDARRIDEVLEFFGLRSYADAPGSSLPYGVQKITEMARAMVSDPELLLLDEPVNGMNAEEVQNVSALLRRMKGEYGVTILLIEHNMSLVMTECSAIHVLSYGLNLAEGTPAEVSTDERVIEAYLGKRGGEYVA
jgi:branched-chain amino acid transport system ATP-binding protein